MIHKRTLHAFEFEKIVHYLADLCVSVPGRKQALAITPLPHMLMANEAFALYEEYKYFSEVSAENQFRIGSFPDITSLLENMDSTREAERKGYSLDTDAFWALLETLKLAWSAITSITTPLRSKSWPLLYQRAAECQFPETLLAALTRCISEDGNLRDEASPELGRIRNEIRKLHQTCLRKVKEFAEKYNIQHYLQDEFITLTSDRYVLPLKANFKGRLQGIVHDWSQTGETCYFEPIFLVEINNRLTALKREEYQEERQILNYLTALLLDNLEGTKNAYNLLGLLDFLNAKNLMNFYLRCETITFTGMDAGIELLDARHPLLALNGQDCAFESHCHSPVPLHIELKSDEKALIITGGNAGGKTVCLKTLGLITAMAMSGLPVPVAKGSHLPWFERVDAFIGDEQSLDDQVSTFSAPMEHLAKAWKHLDDKSLVILDEFGSGTDPAEGAALAQAVMDCLLKKDCLTVCATHFPALKSYALTHEHVTAASMIFNPATNKPLYKLAYGQVGASHALEVARECGLPEEILTRAKHYLLQDGDDPAPILARLNELAIEREKEISELQREQQKARAQLQEKKTALQKEREYLQIEIKNRIAELLEDKKKDKITAKQAIKGLGGLRAELGLDKEASRSILPPPADFTPGMKIFHTAFNRSGHITELDTRKGKARIDMDGVSLWANLNELRLSPEVESQVIRSQPKNLKDGAALTLDLRGMRADEAISKLETFLDKALLAGFSEVEIIHGRGTGALRRQVNNFLQIFPGIASFSVASEERGGDGMTLVTFK